MTHEIIHNYTFDSGVRASVVQRVKQLRGQDSFEPVDFDVVSTKLYVNDHPANPKKHWAIVDFVIERGSAK